MIIPTTHTPLTSYCGYIAIAGRPNVGKSTLLNALLDKKLSITSKKPQTTRHRILGIKSDKNTQLIFVDTPGIHFSESGLLNQKLNRTALSVLKDVDIIIWVVEAAGLSPEDEKLLEKFKKIKIPLIIAVNKWDVLKKSDQVLILINQLSQQFPQAEIIPVSAKKKIHLKKLENLIRERLPQNPFFFDEKTLTDRDEAFVASERVREKLVRFLGQELPYAVTVSVQEISHQKTRQQQPIMHISAMIWVEKDNQKKIVIGKNGEKLKLIGQKARLSLEKYFHQKIFLTLWVKVKTNWSENALLLNKILE